MAYSKHKKEPKSLPTQQTIDVSVVDNSVTDNASHDYNQDDSEHLSPDSITVESDSEFDDTESLEDIDDADDDEINIDFGDKISFKKLQEKYEIGRDTLYKRLKHLKIAAWKVSGKSCYDAMQLAHLDGLQAHIKSGKKMETYPKPEPTGPSSESTAKKPEISSSIVLSQNGNVETKDSSDKIDPTPIQKVFSKADVKQINSDALERLKTMRLAVIEVTRGYQENPDLIPSEILQEIEEAEMAAISTPLSHKPYYDPKALAQLVFRSL